MILYLLKYAKNIFIQLKAKEKKETYISDSSLSIIFKHLKYVKTIILEKEIETAQKPDVNSMSPR